MALKQDNAAVIIDDDEKEEEPLALKYLPNWVSDMVHKSKQAPKVQTVEESVVIMDSDEETSPEVTVPNDSALTARNTEDQKGEDSDYDDTFGPNTDMPVGVTPHRYKRVTPTRTQRNQRPLNTIKSPQSRPASVIQVDSSDEQDEDDGIKVINKVVMPVKTIKTPDTMATSKSSSVRRMNKSPVSTNRPRLPQAEEEVSVCEADSPTVEIDVAMETPVEIDIAMEPPPIDLDSNGSQEEGMLIVSTAYSIPLSAFNDDEQEVSSSTMPEDSSSVESQLTNKCWRCSEKVPGETALINHFDRHHPDQKPFQCEKCGKQYMRLQTLLEHMEQHKAIDVFLCSCGKDFSSRSDLSDHQNLVGHPSIETDEKLADGCFKCKFCGDQFSELEFATHSRTVHGKEVFPCTVCGRVMTSAWHLKQHLYVHDRVKPKLFACNICDQEFSYATALWWHNKKHHKSLSAQQPSATKSVAPKRAESRSRSESTPTVGCHPPKTQIYRPPRKPQICSICGEGFDYNITLYMHKKNEHGIETTDRKRKGEPGGEPQAKEPHIFEKMTGKQQCQSCQQGFPSVSALLLHYKPKPGVLYPCDLCNQQFQTSCGFIKHQQQQHCS